MFNVYALIFGTFGGILVTVTNEAPLGPFWATYFNNATDGRAAAARCVKTTLFGAIIAIVCCYKGLTAKGGAEGRRPSRQPGGRHRLHGDRRLQLRLHADAAGHEP